MMGTLVCMRPARQGSCESDQKIVDEVEREREGRRDAAHQARVSKVRCGGSSEAAAHGPAEQ